ncbi:hypothetical protein Q604_UNBC05214G0002, partial [human gut metagenome]
LIMGQVARFQVTAPISAPATTPSGSVSVAVKVDAGP